MLFTITINISNPSLAALYLADQLGLYGHRLH